MRPLTIIVVLIMMSYHYMQAQTSVIIPSAEIKKYQIPRYPFPAENDTAKVPLYFSYAKAEIYNPVAAMEIDPARIKGVDLVFTRYPYNFEDWLTDYDWLLQARLKALSNLIPSLFSRTDVRWRYVLQTDCKTEPEAMSMFHGLILHVAPANNSSLYTRLQSLRKRDPYLDEIAQIVYGESEKLDDSTLYYVMKRNPQWQDMLVVMDWTSSMYKNGASAIRWYREKLDQRKIKHLVLFNDGNKKHYTRKEVGRTGGIYYISPDDIEKVLLTMLKVRRNGIGGDSPENDIEALLIATKNLKDYKDVILIADRNSSVRDIRLLTRLNRPIRIILFNQRKDPSFNPGYNQEENHWIHPHYFTLAGMTGGSIHMENKDIINLDQIPEGGEYYWKGITYQKLSNGAFRHIK